jgi:hypothetical protein
MILFNLRCAQGHGFEEWFASSAEFDAKAATQALKCPACGDNHIEKGLMAPRINGGAAEPIGPCGRAACAAGPCQMLD